MALVGGVSLTNKEGVFLGSVNIDNLNATAGDILYSANGYDLDGLALGAGLQNTGVLETVGNPEIQLTSNSIYVNDNVSTIQSAIDSVSQADTIFISSGSYGEPAINITNKYNISLINPSSNAGTICEVLNGLNIDGTSELIRVSNLQIKGSNCILKGVGRNLFTNLNFTGTSVPSPLVIEIGKNSTKYMTFQNCQFNQFCDVGVNDFFASTVYFINCDFGGCTINLNNASPLQVIFNNCAGFTALPSTSKATFIGLNVLTTGASQVNTYDLKTTLINGSAYPPASSGVSIANQANTRVPFETAVSNALDSSANLTFNSGTNTLAVPNLTVTNINGSAPATSNVSVTSQAVNRLITATSTTDALHANQNATWDGTQLSLFNTSKVNIGRGNNASSAISNTAVGASALPSITTGTGNTVIGNNSEAISTQSNNTIIGSGNGANMTSGGTHLGNTIVGQGNNIATTGTQNAIIMGQGSKTGSTSVAIGNDILNNTGMNSVYIGHQAGRSATSTTNVVIGSTAATSMTSGSANVIIGYFTEFTTNPTQSVVVGNNASAKGGLGSVAIGYAAAGNGKIGANSSLALGYNTQTGSTYDNCACIGQNMPSTTVAANNEMVMGNASNYVRFQQPIVNPSDARDKIDIKDAALGLDFIQKLKPRMWRSNLRTLYNEAVTDENGNVEWKQLPNDGSKAGKRYHYGIVAQELKEVLDEMGIDFVALKDTSVTGGGTGDFQIAYGEFFGVFIKAFQELSAKNNDLEARIKALESR